MVILRVETPSPVYPKYHGSPEVLATRVIEAERALRPLQLDIVLSTRFRSLALRPGPDRIAIPIGFHNPHIQLQDIQ